MRCKLIAVFTSKFPILTNEIYKVILPNHSCLAVATLADIMPVTLPTLKHFTLKI